MFIYTHARARGRIPLNKWSARSTGRYIHNKHKRRTSMSSAGFEPAIPAVELLQPCVFDRTANGSGLKI